ncbi:MAG TPA: YraN family protein [Actinomycetospora sp.]|jgi:hypothetical protein|uniref:YraN family protein n=1 Tax=Actinomycetospora sp. TaxID=1872135 RepID=UPI002F418E4A
MRPGGGTAGGGAAGGGAAKDELGREGERLAVEHLVARGLVILARNWRRREGELDVVATDGHRMVGASHKSAMRPPLYGSCWRRGAAPPLRSPEPLSCCA